MAAGNQRIPNFTQGEINLLLEIIKSYKVIVESKKTDAISWKQKDEAWIKIAAEFNARSGAVSRGFKNLRGKYDNLKKIAKKKFAAEKMERYKTGGGAFTPIEITTTDVHLKEMMDIAMVDGHHNSFDSDGMVEVVMETDNDQLHILPFRESLFTTNISKPGPSSASDFIDDDIKASSLILTDNSHLPQVTSPVKSKANKTNGTPSIKRKVLKNDLTADCRIRVNELSEAKLELIKLQVEALRADMRIKLEESEIRVKQVLEQHELEMLQKKEEHALKIKKLETEIKCLL